MAHMWERAGGRSRAQGIFPVSISLLVLFLVAAPGIPSVGAQVHKVSLSEVRTFVYNIQNVDTVAQRRQLVGTHFDMYILEPSVTESGNQGFDIQGLIRDIRDYVRDNYHKDPIILAYIDIGQAEDWRWYWQPGWGVGNPAWIAGHDPDGWSGCYPVAYWYSEWEDYVIYGSNGMSFVESALTAGFDGIFMDWVEAFSDVNVTARAAQDGVDPADAMFDFIEKIRTQARSGSASADPDFLMVAQNASDLYEENPGRYESLVDAIAVEGLWYDGDGGFDDWDDPGGYNVPADDLYPGWPAEVLQDLGAMKGRLPIFTVEYAQDSGGRNYASEVYNLLAPAEGFVAYATRRSLAQLSTTPYPPSYHPHDYYPPNWIWSGAEDLGGSWRRLGWFGFFNVSSDPWIWHHEHGWLYPFGTDTSSLWFWDVAMNAYWWTFDAVYPNVYRSAPAAWLYYHSGATPQRQFFNYTTLSWEPW